jgi:hypothetical protein
MKPFNTLAFPRKCAIVDLLKEQKSEHSDRDYRLFQNDQQRKARQRRKIVAAIMETRAK